jgi:hypothetical protein
MFLQPDGILMNRAEVSKWGIMIGEVTLVFQRWPLRNQSAMPAGLDRGANVLPNGQPQVAVE